MTCPEQKSAIDSRVARLPWGIMAAKLRDDGVAEMPPLFNRKECAALVATLKDDNAFHKRVVMEDKGYGRGHYGYFDTPPARVSTLREAFYEATVNLANTWAAEAELHGQKPFGVTSYPDTYKAFAAQCTKMGQPKNACLLLEYGHGGYNEPHQDKYGKNKIAYPFQLVVQLAKPGKDFKGGEFLLLEDKGAIRSFNPVQGAGVIFPSVIRFDNHDAPRIRDVRHAVAEVRGTRHTLGIIAHGMD